MLMLLTIVFLSLAAVAVMVLMIFGISPEDQQGSRRKIGPAARSSQFFASEPERLPESEEVPVEVLLSQIQRHVRLEQAAAESFVQLPNTESLRSRTASPLVN